MRGNEEKAQKTSRLQAIVQSGKLGLYPFNSLALSALFHGQAQSIIAARGDVFCDKLRQKSEFVVSSQTVNIQNKISVGFCDTFYRGKLPELVIVTSGMASLPEFIDDYMDFVEKLFSLGFLLGQDADEVTVLDQYVPQVIIASYGLVFDAVVEKLALSLKNINAISSRQKDRLLQKFSRGIFSSPNEGYDTQLNANELFTTPFKLHLSGSKSMYLIRVTKLLEQNGINYDMNPNGEIGVLEQELNLAYKHLVHRILPLLQHENRATAISPEQLKTQLDQLGQKLGLLPGLVTASAPLQPGWDLRQFDLSTVDLAIVHQIKVLASSIGLPELQETLQTLSDAISEKLAATMPQERS
jgi:hypothetical protein